MYAADGRLVVSASDLVSWLACRHLTGLERQVAWGELARPTQEGLDNTAARRGDEHEAALLAEMRAAGRSVVDIGAVGSHADLVAAQERTVRAMRAGVDVVYQAAFFDGTWRAHADFLEKRPGRPSAFGDWSYEVADAKLARRMKVPAVLQMALYADLLTAVQQVEPEHLHVLTGRGTRESVRFADCAAYARHTRARFLAELHDPPIPTYPLPVPACELCPWSTQCTERRRADDHLSLVAGLRSEQRDRLERQGVSTVAQLAMASPKHLAKVAIGPATRERLVQQARLQVRERETGQPYYELLPAVEWKGLARLPEPSPGDLFFDIEGDPYAGPDGLEYLWGLSDTRDEYSAYWAHDPAAERTAVEAVVDRIMAAWAADPGMHVYHYAPYEPTRLKAVTSRYDTRTQEVDGILRAGLLVDLYAVTREGLRISKESYSIKKLEAFYRPDGRAGEVTSAAASIVGYERWLVSGQQSELDAIEAYNRDDCISTRELRDWLEHRRAELADRDVHMHRPQPGDPLPSQVQQDAEADASRLTAALLAGLPDDPRQRTTEQQATWLLAQQVGWHRREARSDWWEHYRLLDLDPEDLTEEAAALGPLTPPVHVRDVDRSSVWRHEFPPQETKAQPGDQMLHAGGSGSSTVVRIHAEEGWVEIKRARNRTHPHPEGLIPPTPFDDTVLRKAVHRLGTWVAEHGIDGAGAHRAARDLLLRCPPRILGGFRPLAGVDPVKALGEAVLGLDAGVLAVQGPPGTGKTYAGSRAILALLRAGRTVGVTAPSHKAIGNLLDAVMAAAATEGVAVRAMQKAEESQRCQSPHVRCVGSNSDVVRALDDGCVDVVAGTAWLFGNEKLTGRIDVLVVDEAGQLSLANTLAVAQAARSLVLLGDPQQLQQPSRGAHPDGANPSALEHMLGGADTIPPDLGFFLPTSYRMCQPLCQVVSDLAYDGRLEPSTGARDQAVVSAAGEVRTGVEWRPVVHTQTCRSASTEEAEAARAVVNELLDARIRDDGEPARPLRAEDILVVAPYNAHVSRLRGYLPEGVRVGTVDKFQGQEAPVVIVSLAATSGADAAHGIGFLLDRHRLNVALSRGRALAVVIGSPGLLDTAARSIDQLRQINALCRLAGPREI
ncbi:MAG: TM0106 family RecB-like putative nuclease [Actinomycetota bacterium]